MADKARNSHASPPPPGRLDGFPPRRRHLLLAAGCIALIYLVGVTGKWWPSPDSALYLGLARSLAGGQGYQFNGETSNIVTPGLPIMLAALRLMFGGGYWAPNLFMAVCGMAAVALAYRAMSRLTSPRMALAAALCCAFSYTYYIACHRILTDAPFALLFWASVCASLRARGGNLWWLLAGAALAVCALTVRIPGVMTVGPMAIGLLLDRTERISRKRLIILGCGLLAVAAGSLGLFYLLGRLVSEAEPLYAESLRWMPVLDMLRRLGQGLAAFPYAMAEMLTGQKGFIAFGLLASACLVIGGAFSWMRGRRMPITCVVLNVAGLAVVGGANAVRSRYLLPVLPFIAYLTIEGLIAVTWAVAWRVKRRPRRLAPLIAATVFVVFAVGFNAPRLLRNATYYSYLSHTPRYYDVIRHGRHAELFPVAELLRELCPPEGRIALLGDDTSIIHYLTERRVIRSALRRYDDEEIRRVMKGLHARADTPVAVVDMSEGPEEFRRALRRALEQSERLERVYRGERWHVYRFTGPAASSVPSAAAWPHWRGPDRNGISREKGWRTDWPKDGPKRLWKAQVGVGFSSVSVRDGRVYTMGHAKGIDTVYCLDADTGRVIWKHPYPCKPERANAGPRATPTLDGKRVYAFSSAGHIMSLDAATGRPDWSKNIQQELEADPVRWGLSGSPLVVGKLLILNAGEGGVALDKATGKVVWQLESRGGPSYASAVLFRAGDRQCVALMGGREIVAAALADGKVLWRHPWEPSFPNNCADPIFSGDRVFISSAYSAGCAVLRFEGDSAKVVWKNDEMNNHFSSCVLLDGMLYGFDGDVRKRSSLKCIEFATGKVKWATRLKGSLLAADGKLIILTTSGELIVAAASAGGYKQLARAKVLSGKCWTPPVLAGGRVFCRSHEGDLVCVDVQRASP